jgi:hypothetical protein
MLERMKSELKYHSYRSYHPIVSIVSIVLIGLCMYLDILLEWGCSNSISISTFDAFLYKYPRYMFERKQMKGESVPSYHVWFEKQFRDHRDGQLGDRHSGQLGDHRIGGLLNKDVLREIVHENPYSWAYAEAAMRYIAQ